MDENVIQLILVVLIGVGYAVAAIVKKMDRWIQVHRLPPDTRQRQPGANPQPQASPPHPQQTPPTEPSPPRRVPGRPPRTPFDLMRELEKALGGLPEEVEEKTSLETPLPGPRRAPISVQVREESSREEPPVSTPALAAAGPGAPRRETRLALDGLRTQDAARVHRRHLEHLAVLRGRSDIRRGIVIHEILAPPRALRPQVR